MNSIYNSFRFTIIVIFSVAVSDRVFGSVSRLHADTRHRCVTALTQLVVTSRLLRRH